MRLLHAELRRGLRRRATIGALLFLLLVTGFMIFGEHQHANEFGSDARAQATASFNAAHADWVRNHVQQEKDCRSATPADAPASVCEVAEPKLSDFLPFGGTISSMVGDVRAGLQTLLLFGTFLLGASLVCAEFSSGSLSTWLTFVPRRVPVYVSKVAAAGVLGLIVAVIASAVLGVGLWLIAANVGLSVSSAQRSEFIATLGRASLLGLYGGMVGAAMGFVVRHTAAALGVAIGYLIVFEMVLRSAWAGIARWILGPNVSAFVAHGSTFDTDRCSPAGGGAFGCETITHHISFVHGSLAILAAAIVILLIGLASFTRRDVN